MNNPYPKNFEASASSVGYTRTHPSSQLTHHQYMRNFPQAYIACSCLPLLAIANSRLRRYALRQKNQSTRLAYYSNRNSRRIWISRYMTGLYFPGGLVPDNHDISSRYLQRSPYNLSAHVVHSSKEFVD